MVYHFQTVNGAKANFNQHFAPKVDILNSEAIFVHNTVSFKYWTQRKMWVSRVSI